MNSQDHIFTPQFISFGRDGTLNGAETCKPRVQAFRHLFDQFNWRRVFVDRGHESSNANYCDVEMPHLGCLPTLVRL